ncbi:MAG: UDP-glucose 6-dehydrogenase, partial [Pseudonocardiales bacterium]|nr:UDP-glucose 6-dehydrogenase [Pseudonocardiales bacterium]
WDEFKTMEPETIGTLVGHRNIVDGRNVLDPVAWRAAGWHYRALGRP